MDEQAGAMLTNCPKCGKEIEKTEGSARNHVRHDHKHLKDRAKMKLRNEICKFVDTSGFKTAGRTKEENQLTKMSGIM